MKYIYILLVFVFLNGCGYKPTISYIKEHKNKNVFIVVKMDKDYSKNSVFLKDYLINMTINKLDSVVVNNKNNSDITIEGEILSVKIQDINLDSDGYANSYRVHVSVNIRYTNEHKSQKNIVLKNYYDYSSSNHGTTTSINKHKAINEAIKKTLTNLIAKIIL